MFVVEAAAGCKCTNEVQVQRSSSGLTINLWSLLSVRWDWCGTALTPARSWGYKAARLSPNMYDLKYLSFSLPPNFSHHAWLRSSVANLLASVQLRSQVR